ncbi:hypothetical protein GNX71_12995 [Variovorax sp. RKNM96]|uniref:hypothetical protein n=1 Tax=Variovorax sp. RKNM96 TaxID=2681552 RepID=UPI001980DE63|nr:hypothetical protein [Variovorax sp. RKNM96]QSI30451.1 hypothetical protein GNX71_12995 [Variovorax sp. RKNM96]
MSDRLFVSVLGNRNTGKTKTWHTLFDADVRTGKHERKLYLNKAQWVSVFLVSGSPEERKMPIQEMLGGALPSIVLCSAQYRDEARQTFDHFFQNEYQVFVQWLNPGYHDPNAYSDDLSFGNYLLDNGATLQVRNGRRPAESRVGELRQLILGWATVRGLVQTDFPA